ncbi:MAG: site-2 protease family protein [Oscillospiraceae bacterium]|nr:site-2 protease family protein [Oscillospiraceae bacterium]
MSDILKNLDWSVLTDILFTVVPALICITLHELSHGYVAYRLGDNTAKNAGRLTLNPIKHIDPVGLVVMLVARFGWAKPVPVDMRNFKDPKKGMAVTALAGPVSNVLIAVIAYVIYGAVFTVLYDKTAGGVILTLLYTTGYLSISLAVFNIIPIPPLDGSKVLFALLPDRAYMKLMRYERYGFILLIIIVALGVTRGPLRTVTGFLDDALMNLAAWSNGLVNGLVK